MTSFDRFIAWAKEECDLYAVRVVLTDTAYVISDGLPCSGFFSGSDMVLKVATGSPYWREVLIHEFAHFLQWRGASRLWVRTENTLFYDWMQHAIDLSPQKAELECYTTRDLELDCERRAVRLINRHELPFNLPAYIQRANSYIFAHQLMLEYRGWPSRAPHTWPALFRTMPIELLKNTRYNHPPAAFRTLAAALFPAKEIA